MVFKISMNFNKISPLDSTRVQSLCAIESGIREIKYNKDLIRLGGEQLQSKTLFSSFFLKF